jgi:copper transport protein
MRRSLLVLATLLAGWLLGGVLTAGPAAAHASLITTDPGQGARVEQAPSKVTLTFDEPVSLGAGYARVLAAQGARVDTGAASVTGAVVTIPVRSGLPDGGYLVTYRVVSDDSHPIAGAFSYVVGNGAFVPTGAAPVSSGDPTVSAAMPLMRGIGYAALALAVGIPLLAFACWPAGWASGRMRRMATWGAAALAVSSLASFLLQGPYAAGSDLGSTTNSALLGATLGSLAGQAMLVRAGLALVLFGMLDSAWRSGTAPSRWLAAGAGLVGIALSLTFALVGHAAAGPGSDLAIVVTTVHVGAMVVWLGGLTGLVAVLLRPETSPTEAAAALPVFSRLAFGSMVALIVTGTLQSVREVASPEALLSTEYGRLLLAKLALVVVILAAAGLSRVWVQQHFGATRARPGALRRVSALAFAGGPAPDVPPAGPDPVQAAAAARIAAQAEGASAHLRALRRSVVIEFVCAVGVLAVAAVLVASPPAKAAVAQPVNATLVLQGTDGPNGSVQVSVDPARTGANSVHVYLYDDQGRLTQPVSIQVTLAEREQQIGPIVVPLQPGGPGHYTADGFGIPKAGTWTLAVLVRSDQFTATTASTDFPVR